MYLTQTFWLILDSENTKQEAKINHIVNIIYYTDRNEASGPSFIRRSSLEVHGYWDNGTLNSGTINFGIGTFNFCTIQIITISYYLVSTYLSLSNNE